MAGEAMGTPIPGKPGFVADGRGGEISSDQFDIYNERLQNYLSGGVKATAGAALQSAGTRLAGVMSRGGQVDTEAAALQRDQARLSREQSARLRSDENKARQIVNRDEYVTGSKDAAASAAAQQQQKAAQMSSEAGGAAALLASSTTVDPTAGIQAQRARQDQKQQIAQNTALAAEQAMKNANVEEGQALAINQEAQDRDSHAAAVVELSNQTPDPAAAANPEANASALADSEPLNLSAIDLSKLDAKTIAEIEKALDALPVGVPIPATDPTFIKFQEVMTAAGIPVDTSDKARSLTDGDRTAFKAKVKQKKESEPQESAIKPNVLEAVTNANSGPPGSLVQDPASSKQSAGPKNQVGPGAWGIR
jgi:hypothetical protein